MCLSQKIAFKMIAMLIQGADMNMSIKKPEKAKHDLPH